jgi:hypothetical protein
MERGSLQVLLALGTKAEWKRRSNLYTHNEITHSDLEAGAGAGRQCQIMKTRRGTKVAINEEVGGMRIGLATCNWYQLATHLITKAATC